MSNKMQESAQQMMEDISFDRPDLETKFAAEVKEKETDDVKSLGIVKNFHLSWFAMVMGWGGTALTIDGFPGATGDFKLALNYIGTVIWFWDLIYCIFFSIFLVVRIVSYPKQFWEMMKTPAQFLFFGCVPMGIAVVGMGMVSFGPHIFGAQAAYTIAQILFWFDVLLCIVSMTVPLFMMIVYQVHKFETMASLWLLPFVSCVVAAAMASNVGPVQNGIDTQINILVTGYVLWGAGIFTAAPLIAVYMSRLVFHGFPPNSLGNSIWVILGPIGQGANGIIHLGRNTGLLNCMGAFCTGQSIPPSCVCPVFTPLSSFGFVASGMTLLIGFAMWGLGLFWIFLASLGSAYHTSKIDRVLQKLAKDKDRELKFMPFSLGHWGVVFPFVTLIMGTYQLYISTNFAFFMWMGRIFAVILVAVSFTIHIKTIRRVFRRTFWLKFK